MAEGTGSDIEDGDFEDLMLESDVRGYLYEPQYSNEQLKLINRRRLRLLRLLQPRQKTCLSRARSPEWLELGRIGGACALTVRLWTQRWSPSAAKNLRYQLGR